MKLQSHLFAVTVAMVVMMAGEASAWLVDGGFNQTSFNSSAWQKNVNQAGNPNDAIAYDQSGVPGTLAVTYTDSQGSDQNTHITRTDLQLLSVGDYVQLDAKFISYTATPNSLVGIAIGPVAVLGSIDRSNSLFIALRGDGIIKSNAYGTAGTEIQDIDTPVPGGFTSSDTFTFRIEKSGAATYRTFWGKNGAASNQLGGDIDFASQSQVPTYPAIYFGNGLSSMVAHIDNFMAGNPGVTTFDNFNDDVFNLNWDRQNYTQFSSLDDTLGLSESSGVLNITYTSPTGSDQTTLLTRGDLPLVDGEAVVISVRLLTGATDFTIGIGLGLATEASGLLQNRANTALLFLRGDGLARGNGYGTGGAEIWDNGSPAIPGYALGSWVTLRFLRVGNTYEAFYGIGRDADATIQAGAAVDFSGHTTPAIPAIVINPGMASFTAEIDSFFTGAGIVPVELAEFETL